jgi:CDP-glucose 4,6-dehydratase
MVAQDKLFGDIYRGKKVLVTGHTGFKGSWLSFWLTSLGADVYGYSLDAPSEPNHAGVLDLDIHNEHWDIRDLDELSAFVGEIRPDIVFHLAAQSLVRPSYKDPVETFSTNFMGTLHLFEACRKTPSVRAIVNVTSDKCYENKEWIWGYRENDRMGGYDPYSASKGTVELLTNSYRNSFFNVKKFGDSHDLLLASARAGNVIGGGDWATDRLVPDLVRAAAAGETVTIRNPLATRPWQHVLEPLSGYLTLGWQLLEKKVEYADGWNFGPDPESNGSVGEVVDAASRLWPAITPSHGSFPDEHHEANLLMLDCSKANKLLKWRPVWAFDETLEKTIGWYRAYYENHQVRTQEHLQDYIRDAREKKLIWTI